MATSFLQGTEVGTENEYFFLRFRPQRECCGRGIPCRDGEFAPALKGTKARSCWELRVSGYRVELMVNKLRILWV